MSATDVERELRQADLRLVSSRIRRARREAVVEGETVKLSHDELIARMGRSSRQHLILLERGEHRPRLELLSAIAEATGRTVEWFLDPDLDPSPFQEEAA
jgi:transcriptional regulator with XRE-family HTH domain